MPTTIKLDDFFTKLWQGKDPFAELEKIEGEIFRQVKTRRTFRFEQNGLGFFAKIHHGVGWKEIFKNLLQFKRPVLGARNEYTALNLLKKAGVDTMTACAFGERGFNPAYRDSFLVTAELKNMISLEDFCRNWKQNPVPFQLKLKLLTRLATMAQTMHRHGLNHRDCYLCHFLLDTATLEDKLPRLYVIDLHRAEIRPQVPFHYLVKDLAGLFFSAMDTGITRHDLYRFIKTYTGVQHLRDTLTCNLGFWRAVNNAARKLYNKEFDKTPPDF